MQGQHIKISRGLDVPISGAPEQRVHDAVAVHSVAVIGPDFNGMKPTMQVAVGDRVRTGQVLFSDKKLDGVVFTAPATGVVREINRGERRMLQSVVIDIEEDDFVDFGSADPSQADAAQVREKIVASGLWSAFRTRPYSKTPAADATPAAIFVSLMDTRPLAADPMILVAEQEEAFSTGLQALLQLTAGPVHCVSRPGANVPGVSQDNRLCHDQFEGPHPAGLAGTHVHYLAPVGAERTVWTVAAADVIAIGKLFLTGKLWVERIISLAGPLVAQPRLLRTRLGANVNDLVVGSLESSARTRIVSGSVLDGRTAHSWSAWLGRFHQQISVLADGEPRKFFHWLNPMLNEFSFANVFSNSFKRIGSFKLTTTRNGSPRAMVPIGGYEAVLPHDTEATPLLRALLVRDTDMAQQLGCLDLDEEDLALCSFVCHSKYEYGSALRACLQQIEEEG